MCFCFVNAANERFLQHITSLLRHFQEHMPHIRLMYNLGYGLSLVSLLLAVIIMIYIK